ALFGGAGDDVENGFSVLGCRGDVEKAKLVRACCIIGFRNLDGIAGVDQIDEIDALDDAAVLYVEAGDNAGFEGHDRSSNRAAGGLASPRKIASASAGSMRPS